jgi:superfamily I DNA and/or RNA helicase
MLSEQDWATAVRHLIKVDTVDSYQGKENRIIILSLTANNRVFDEGYLTSPERTNVAMSRAMDRLFIVGASRMWSQRNTDSPLGKVYAFVKAKVDGKHFNIVNAPVGNDVGATNA